MVNYPNGMRRKNNNIYKIYENRGMDFEHDINVSNNYYKEVNRALIYKKPTPIKIVEMDNVNKCIKKAFFEMPSTTDYNGIYKSKYIDFEAKETLNKTSFPLSNIHKHQIEHLRSVDELGGTAFIIVYFKKLNEIYILDIKDFINLNRQSIPLSIFKEKGILVKQEYLCPINYLDAVDKLYKI